MDWIDCFPIFVLVLCHCSTSFLHGHLSHVNNSPFTVGRVYLLFGLGSHALKRCVTPARAVAKETREQTAMIKEFQSLCYSMYSTLVIHT